MSFDAGNFFNNMFNKIKKTDEVKLDKNEDKTSEQKNISDDNTKILLPKETLDEDIKLNIMNAYGIPYRPNRDEYELKDIVMYGYPDFTPEPEPSVVYDEPYEPIKHIHKYGIPVEPSISPSSEPTVLDEPATPEYGIPIAPSSTPVPTAPEPSVVLDEPATPEYGIPIAPSSTPIPTQPTITVTPQPTVKPTNPWSINIQKIISNILSQIFNNIFSRWR